MDGPLHEVASPHCRQICCAPRDRIPCAAALGLAGGGTDSDFDDFVPEESDRRTPSNLPIPRQSPCSCHRRRSMSLTRTRDTCADSGSLMSCGF